MAILTSKGARAPHQLKGRRNVRISHDRRGSGDESAKIEEMIGDLTLLETSEKTNLVGSINEVVDNVNEVAKTTIWSTEEEVVGTYCDGKPIYKLTMTGYSGIGGVSFYARNIKYPLKIEGFAKRYGDDPSYTPLPTFGDNGEMASLAFNLSGEGAEVTYKARGFSYRHSDIDFTIWYTKTTDY